MKRFFLSALVAAVGFAGTATAQNEADVWILHGINGTDLGAAEEFLVDIQLNDAPLLAAVPFRARTDAYELAPGTYNVKISAADLNNPYSQPPVIDVDLTFAADGNYTVMAHLAEDGAVTASVFEHNLGAAAFGQSRVGVHHTAAAPAVDAFVNGVLTLGSSFSVPGVSNGLQAEADIFFGFWNIALNAAGTQTTVFQSPTRFLGFNKYFGLYFVGTLANGTFEPLLYTYPIQG